MTDGPSVPEELSDSDYLEWLDTSREILKSCRENHRWPKGISQFGWFSSDALRPAWAKIDPERFAGLIPFDNPERSSRKISMADDVTERPRDLPPSPEEYLSKSYHLDHLGGDPNAIFQYAADSTGALLQPWVIEELVAWREWGDRQKFDRFVQEYWNATGVPAAASTLARIERDIAIYSLYLGRNDGSKSQEVLHAEIADVYPVSTETVRKVIKVYNQHRAAWKRGDLFPGPRTRR